MKLIFKLITPLFFIIPIGYFILVPPSFFNFIPYTIFYETGLPTLGKEYQFILFFDILFLSIIYFFIFKIFSKYFDSNKVVKNQENSKESKLKIYRENVIKYESGELENLICPRCNTPTVNIKFGKESYHNRRSVLFVCNKCGNSDTAQYKSEPPFFNERLLVD